jgi:phosphopantothenoylcysteine decarboxylase / phosphopantothenate---cysteine ligase
MQSAVERELAESDVLVMAAAPADYRPADVSTSKLKKTGESRSIALTENADILASTRSARRPGAVVVGFALETDDVVANALRKLDAKALDLIVLNDATEPGAGFAVDTNRVTIFTRGTETPERLPLLTKHEVADAILDRIETMLRGR